MVDTDRRGGEIHRREIGFHDVWAEGTALDDIAVSECFEAITAPENRFVLELLGDVRGKNVLDIGAGLGEAAIYFAKRGADVTAVDISPGMVELCRHNAARHGVRVTGVACSAEALGLPAESFDVAYAANILHHVADRDRFLASVHGVLKPGGLFVAWDPLKYNPLLNVYRAIATGVRTVDETPLGVADLARSRKYFPDVRHREFWLATMTLFLKYFLLDRKSPNRVRYWKAILKETRESIGWWYLPLQRLDDVLLRLPGVRYLAWNMVQWGHKPTGRASRS